MTTACNSLYTLVIPTYNRSDLLERLLSFLEYQKCEYAILVLDSSKDSEHLKQNKCVIEQSNLKIAYERYDSSLFFYDKLREGLQNVKTPYFSFCADDDFLLIDSIKPMLEFLEQSPGYTFTQGFFLRFMDLVNGSVQITLEYRAKSYEHDHPVCRIHDYLIDIEATFYSVFRTEAFRSGLDAAKPIRNLLYSEHSVSLCPLILGKGKGMQVLQYARNMCAHAEPPQKAFPVQWYLEDRAEYEACYQAYKQNLMAFYREHVVDELICSDLEHRLDLINDFYNAEARVYHLNILKAEIYNFEPKNKGKAIPEYTYKYFYPRWSGLRSWVRSKIHELDPDYVSFPECKQRKLIFDKKIFKHFPKKLLLKQDATIARYFDYDKE